MLPLVQVSLLCSFCFLLGLQVPHVCTCVGVSTACAIIAAGCEGGLAVSAHAVLMACDIFHVLQGDEWEEKWGEHYHDSGKVAKYADKWGKAGG